jgi:hypothetical protein
LLLIPTCIIFAVNSEGKLRLGITIQASLMFLRSVCIIFAVKQNFSKHIGGIINEIAGYHFFDGFMLHHLFAGLFNCHESLCQSNAACIGRT